MNSAERVERRRPARGFREQIPAFAHQRGHRLHRLEARGKACRARLRARERRQNLGDVQRNVFGADRDGLERADDGALELRARAARDLGRRARRLERVAEVRLERVPGGASSGAEVNAFSFVSLSLSLSLSLRAATHAKQDGVHETRERAKFQVGFRTVRRAPNGTVRSRNVTVTVSFRVRRKRSPGVVEFARARAARRLERVRALLVGGQRGGGHQQRRRGRQKRVDDGGVVMRSRSFLVDGDEYVFRRGDAARLDASRRLQRGEPPAEAERVGVHQALRGVQHRAERVRALLGLVIF